MTRSHSAKLLLTCLLVTLFCTSSVLGQEKDYYAEFNRFCVESFGATKEALVYQTFGEELKVAEDSLWVRPSQYSAVVAFQTNLPASTIVEFGTSTAYGEKTLAAERRFYTHVHYLGKLKPGTTYHYRLVATDEKGKTIRSADATFKTPDLEGVIRIPEDMGEAPYVLNKAGATYLVTRDMTVDGTAFEVKAEKVTLDLGGHTVIYDNKHWGEIDGDFWKWRAEAKFGVDAQKGTSGLKVFNGTIKQGAGDDSPQANSIGYNPIFTGGCNDMEIAGVTIDYSASQQVGIYAHWGGSNSEFHHNVFLDRGTEMKNRHGAGSRCLLFFGNEYTPGVKTHHNLVKRTRQSGLGGGEVYNNEVYVDSWTTNSFGIALQKGGTAQHNLVFGTGYHVVAFGWGYDLTFHDNFVHLQGQKPNDRFKEFGDQISLNGFRLTQYNGAKHEYDGLKYYNNTIIVTGRDGSEARGVQFFSDPYVKNLVFKHNTIKAVVLDDQTTQVACVVTQGLPQRAAECLPILYQDNTFISNICNVRFGDYYGVGSNHQFENCTFIRIGDNPKYLTFIFDTGYPSFNHVLLNPTFKDGASIDDVVFEGDKQSFTVSYTVTVKTEPKAAVECVSAEKGIRVEGVADEKGECAVAVPVYLNARSGKTNYLPYNITAKLGSRTGSAKLASLDKPASIDVPLK